jgi:hypothetical protein
MRRGISHQVLRNVVRCIYNRSVEQEQSDDRTADEFWQVFNYLVLYFGCHAFTGRFYERLLSTWARTIYLLTLLPYHSDQPIRPRVVLVVVVRLPNLQEQLLLDNSRHWHNISQMFIRHMSEPVLNRVVDLKSFLGSTTSIVRLGACEKFM